MPEAIQNFDFAVLNAIQDIFVCDFMNIFMLIVTFLGGAVIWLAVAAVLLFIKSQRFNSIYIAAAVLFSLLLIECVIKLMFMRERPYLIADFPIICDPPMGTSFPSGHTSISFAAAVTFFKVKKWLGFVGLGFATLVGFTRLYLYVHFPTDVIAGAIIGSLVGLMIIFIVDGFRKLYYRKKMTKSN